MRCVFGVSWVPDVTGCLPSGPGARSPGMLGCPCRHSAGRREPSQCDIATVLTVALSHCDGSDRPGCGQRPSPGDADGREPGISAGAGAPRATRRELRLFWHVSRTVALPQGCGSFRVSGEGTVPGVPGVPSSSAVPGVRLRASPGPVRLRGRVPGKTGAAGTDETARGGRNTRGRNTRGRNTEQMLMLEKGEVRGRT
jgi:hypothetical protein